MDNNNYLKLFLMGVFLLYTAASLLLMLFKGGPNSVHNSMSIASYAGVVYLLMEGASDV